MSFLRQPTLKIGDHGAEIGTWQRHLAEGGFVDSRGLPPVVDEIYGLRTHEATADFQKSRNLAPGGALDAPTRTATYADGFAPFVQAAHFNLRWPKTRVVAIVVIHTMEDQETDLDAAESVALWFAGRTLYPAPRASAHFCVTPNTKVLRHDLVWVNAGDLEEKAELVGVNEHPNAQGHRVLQESKVLRHQTRFAECIEVEIDNGVRITVSEDHKFLARRTSLKKHLGASLNWRWTSASELTFDHEVCAPFEPWSAEPTPTNQYIAGIFDGEGCWTHDGAVSFAQKGGLVFDKTLDLLREMKLPFNISKVRRTGVFVVRLSGIHGTFGLLGQCRPVRLLAKSDRWHGRAIRSRIYNFSRRVIGLRRSGLKEVVSMETSSHTYFSEGIVSHNCVDQDSIVQCVREEDVAWHVQSDAADSGNLRSIGIEHAGRAAETPKDWASGASQAILTRSAELAATLARRHGVPLVRLTPEEVLAGASGFCGHVDVTNAYKVKGGHVDPGPSWPWDEYLQLVAAAP